MIKLKRVDGSDVAIAKHPLYALSFWDRFWGLINKKFSPEFDGIVFFDCNLIHSCFMLYKFDLIFVDKSGKVVKLYKGAAPFKIFYGGKNRNLTAIELPLGKIDEFYIVVGNVLKLER